MLRGQLPKQEIEGQGFDEMDTGGNGYVYSGRERSLNTQGNMIIQCCEYTLEVQINDWPLMLAIQSLLKMAEHSPEMVYGFFAQKPHRLSRIVQPRNVDGSTKMTGVVRVDIEPSKLLQDFLLSHCADASVKEKDLMSEGIPAPC